MRQLLDFPAVEAEDSSREEQRERGVVALSETKTGHGAWKKASSAYTPRSDKGGNGAARARRHDTTAPHPFSEPKDAELWRELTMGEKRADIRRWDAERQREERAFGEVVAEGAAEQVADVRSQVERMGDAYRRNPDVVNSLAPSEATLNRIRQRIANGLERAHDKGRLQGLGAIEAATVAEREVPALIREFCEIDRDSLSVTNRGRWHELYSALRERGYVR